MSQIIEQRIATLLGNYGMLAFLLLAAATWLPLEARAAHLVALALTAYAALVLACAGAVHWGLALATPELDKRGAWRAFGWSATAALLGWLALLGAVAGAPRAVIYAFLIGDLLLARLMDGALLAQYARAPDWYAPLRTRLTIGASIGLALAIAATL
ncbi:MAG TPA: DUF3429 family protein [Burkholderiaceae bacterium]|nr:DUF3429 family protein [Burkholderiaceae bacterium]